jgi:hypothetical protein
MFAIAVITFVCNVLAGIIPVFDRNTQVCLGTMELA